MIETSEYPFAPIVFFPEGSVTNGTVLSKFRRGAFSAEKRITPMFLEYEYFMVSPSYDCLLGLPSFVLMISSSIWCN